MVDSLVKNSSMSCKPWKGPLPKARVSEPRTIGDAIAKAFKMRRSVNQGSPAIIDAGSGEQPNKLRESISAIARGFL